MFAYKVTAHCTKRSENPFMTDPRLFKLSKLCITKLFLCSFVSIADETSEAKDRLGSEINKDCLCMCNFFWSTSLSNHCLSWADYIGCRLTVSYVKKYVGCLCAHSTLRSMRELAADMLQITSLKTIRMWIDKLVWTQCWTKKYLLCCVVLLEVNTGSGFE